MEQRQVTYEHVSPVRPSVHPPHRESRVCMPKRRPVPVYNWNNVDASRSEVNAYLFYIKTANNLIKGYDPRADTINKPHWVKDQNILGEKQKTGFYYGIKDVQTRVKCTNCRYHIRKDFGVIANTKTHLWIKLSLLLLEEYTLFFRKHCENQHKGNQICQGIDRYTFKELKLWEVKCDKLRRESDIQEENPGESYPAPRSYYEGVTNSVPPEEGQGEASGKVRTKKKTGLRALFKVWNGGSST